MEQHHWFFLLSKIPQPWLDLLKSHPDRAQREDWLGVYSLADSEMLTVIWRNFTPNHSILLSHAQDIHLDGTIQLATVNAISRRITLSDGNPDSIRFRGIVRRVRVVQFTKGRTHTSSLLFVGPVSSLSFDPLRWRWRSGRDLLDYTTALGRNLLNQHHQLKRPIYSKWSGHLPITFLPD